jgi:hypothetical protein
MVADPPAAASSLSLSYSFSMTYKNVPEQGRARPQFGPERLGSEPAGIGRPMTVVEIKSAVPVIETLAAAG